MRPRFDRVYAEGALTSTLLTDIQTALVPTGGSTIVEFTLEVPGRYILVDHSLSRLEHGLAAFYSRSEKGLNKKDIAGILGGG